MPTPSAPSNFNAQQSSQQAYLSWDLVAGATSYSVQRSLDGVTYAPLSSPVVNSYTDANLTNGTQYYYQVASTNASGTGTYTQPASVVPAPPGEMSLGELRLTSQQRADRVGSQFVSLTEWNFFINQACYELYDLLITTYEDYFKAPNASFQSQGSTQTIYPLPDGIRSFTNDAGQSFVAPALYKLLGLDLQISNANNAWVTVGKYNFIDRNKFVYPNANSTIYGVFNLQYRLMGTGIELIPPPASQQTLRFLYAPKLPKLMADTDLTTIGGSGWLQYIIVRAAKYALDKEESDTSKLDQELEFLVGRISAAAQNRDAGRADTISDTRQGTDYDGGGPYNGFKGGF